VYLSKDLSTFVHRGAEESSSASLLDMQQWLVSAGLPRLPTGAFRPWRSLREPPSSMALLNGCDSATWKTHRLNGSARLAMLSHCWRDNSIEHKRQINWIDAKTERANVFRDKEVFWEIPKYLALFLFRLFFIVSLSVSLAATIPQHEFKLL